MESAGKLLEKVGLGLEEEVAHEAEVEEAVEALLVRRKVLCSTLVFLENKSVNW